MIKDIDFPEVTRVLVAVVKEADNDWKVYLINRNSEAITGVLVTSKGYGNTVNQHTKTSTLRHFLDTVNGCDFQPIEVIKEDVFKLTNEYWVSFYLNGKMYDKKYIFLAESIRTDNLVTVPILNKKGILHP